MDAILQFFFCDMQSSISWHFRRKFSAGKFSGGKRFSAGKKKFRQFPPENGGCALAEIFRQQARPVPQGYWRKMIILVISDGPKMLQKMQFESENMFFAFTHRVLSIGEVWWKLVTNFSGLENLKTQTQNTHIQTQNIQTQTLCF